MILIVACQNKNGTKSLRAKTWMIMKLTIALLLFFAFQVSAKSDAQVITIVKKNVHLVEIFKSIEQQTGYHFFYDKEVIQKTAPIDVALKDATLEQALVACLKGQELTYTVVKNTVVIRSKNKITYFQAHATLVPIEANEPPPIEIHGQVRDENENLLANASVTIKGTNKGVTTNNDGGFTISVPDGQTVLIISFTGYKNQEILIGNRTTINITLVRADNSLSEVLVTALGIKREARSLGYSTTTVNMDQISGQETNFGNSLLGKIAGVNVVHPASGPGGSSKIRIRGQSSFGGDNTPLIVVNGSPINDQSSQTNKGADAGDGLLSINESDIQTITVLKGAAASALYGYRAKDGVIIITTKSGTTGTGIGVEYNFNYGIENAIDYTDFQYEYGEGLNGKRQQNVAEARSMGTWSFGEKMDGVPTIMFDGTMQPYSPFRDRVKLFYRRGDHVANSIALSGGNDKGAFRLSFSNTDANSIVLNSDFHNKILNLGLNHKFSPKLSVQANINYSHSYNHNPVKVSGKTGINETIYSVNNSTPAVVLKEYENPDGTELHYSRYTSKTNPFWIMNKQFENQTRDRLIANGHVRYDFTDDIYIRGQVSQDYFVQPYENNTPTGTATLGRAPVGYNGNYYQSISTFREVNLDFLIGAKHTFGNFGTSITIGGNQMDQKSTANIVTANNFYAKDVYTIGNGQIVSPSYYYKEKKVNSLYSSADFSFKNLWFLSLTARNDWFSTLNIKSNNYLYPSASTSFIFSDAMKSKPTWLNYGKLRLAYAEVGGDTDPYQNTIFYSINTSTLNGSALGSIATTVSPNANLRPLKVKETEAGIELRTLNSRVNIDLSVYNKNTVDEILNVDISQASGYNQTKVNIGKLRNRGVEALLTLVPIIGIFHWEATFDGAYNISKVLQLANNQTKFDVAGNLNDNLGTISHEVGLPLASLRVYDYKRDAKGRIIVSSGLPLQGNMITMGSAIPKWTGAWMNSFTFKKFKVFTQVDFKAGHKIMSDTHYNEMRFGLTKETLIGREGGVIMDAVNADGTPNTTAVTSYNYFANLSDGLIGTMNVFNASFIKWRVLSIGYDLTSLVNKTTFIKSLSMSVDCRNVLMIKKFIPNMDPESSGETSDNMNGVEVFAMPTTRSFGLSLNLKF